MTPDQLQPGTAFERAAMEVRAKDAQTRTFTALGVPYGQRIETAYWREEFAPGSVEGADRALILWCHRDHEVLGKVTAYRDTPEGFEITAQLSNTERGREAYTLLQDGVIDRMSIGFQVREYRVETEEDGTETVIHTKVRALEFSLVPFPAYDGAEVLAVRSLARKHTTTDSTEENPVMSENLTRADLDSALEPLGTELDTLRRTVASVRSTGNTAADELTDLARNFRSMGDFLRASASVKDDRHEQAVNLHRAAAAGATTSDAPAFANDNFLGLQRKFVEERRRTINMFTTAVIPAKGMTLEYAQLDLANSTALVGRQPAELDALPGPSLVRFKTASAPVETYGGWTRLSRQIIERSDLPYLDSVLRIMTKEYAKQTEAAVKTRLITELDALAASTNPDATLTTSKAATALTIGDWAGLIVDAGEVFDDRGYSYAGLAVSPDIYKHLATQTASDGRPLLNISGQPGSNVAGTMNLTTGDGELLRVAVKIARGTTGRAFFWDPSAIEVRESGNAPILLQDEDIIILGKDFSLYGYMAVTVPFADALLPVEFSVV